MRKLFVIINPMAKNGGCLKTWGKVKKYLSGISYEEYFTKGAGNAAEMAAYLAEKHSDPFVIAAVGGDGTVHEVMNGIIHYDHITLACIPAGSGNDFSRGFKLPKKPIDCANLLRQFIDPPFAVFDSGCYHLLEKQISGCFVNNLGAGFDAFISRAANKSKVKKWLNVFSLGKLVYVYFLVLGLFKYKPAGVHITIDNQHYFYKRTWFVTVSNHAYFGGGMKISPKAIPNDGELDITIVHGFRSFTILLVFASVFWGGHLKMKGVASFKGKKVTVETEVPLYVHADGEDVGCTPVHVNVVPDSWKLLQINQSSNQETIA